MRITKKSPLQRYKEEIKNGGLNIRDDITKYMEFTYLSKPPLIKPVRNTELYSGHIYTYMYDPKWKDILDFYDTNPLALIYNKWKANNGNVLYSGINLHFLPPDAKLALIDAYWKWFYRFSGERVVRFLPFTYTDFFKIILKKIKRIDYGFALRSYIINRVTNGVKVSLDDWGKIPLTTPNFIHKASIQEIYMKYYGY